MISFKIELYLQSHRQMRQAIEELCKKVESTLKAGEKLPLEKTLYSEEGNIAQIIAEVTDSDQAQHASLHVTKQLAEDLQMQFIKQQQGEES